MPRRGGQHHRAAQLQRHHLPVHLADGPGQPPAGHQRQHGHQPLAEVALLRAPQDGRGGGAVQRAVRRTVPSGPGAACGVSENISALTLAFCESFFEKTFNLNMLILIRDFSQLIAEVNAFKADKQDQENKDARKTLCELKLSVFNDVLSLQAHLAGTGNRTLRAVRGQSDKDRLSPF